MIKGHVPKGVRVQVPPQPNYAFLYRSIEYIKYMTYGVNTAINGEI